MRITQWGELGLHFVAYIATEAANGRTTVGASEIAKAQGLALDYTQQILHRLRDGGLLKSVRGPNGGYCLSRPAEDISLLDILIASEGESFEVICETRPLNEDRCSPDVHCGIRHVWYGLRNHVNDYLKSHTLLNLINLKQSELITLNRLNSKK